MIRRFNYTGRIRINRADVRVTVRTQDGVLSFDADLSTLRSYEEISPDSLVFVEAYRQTSWMRFAFGRVGALSAPDDRRLTEFDNEIGILFRVKVTLAGDEHKLVAEADRIPLQLSEQDEVEKSPLLPVKPERLEHEVFRLDFTQAGPILLVNSLLGDYRSIALSRPFLSLVYPAVLRQVLTQIVLVDEHDDFENSTDWRSQWLRFASLLPGLGELPPEEDQELRTEWIERATGAFAQRIRSCPKFAEFWKGEEA